MERRRQGFTLIELMIVVSIIGILASIVVPKFATMVRRAKEGQTKGSLGAIRSSVSIYYSDMEGQFPAYIDGLLTNAKYMSSIPFARLPDYHAAYNTGTTTSSCGPPPCNVCVNILNNAETWPGTPPPSWVLALGGDALDNSRAGDVWISCSHTDSKGTVWTTY
jgi:general secretion pathway protein G